MNKYKKSYKKGYALGKQIYNSNYIRKGPSSIQTSVKASVTCAEYAENKNLHITKNGTKLTRSMRVFYSGMAAGIIKAQNQHSQTVIQTISNKRRK